MTLFAAILAVLGGFLVLGWTTRHAVIFRELHNSNILSESYPVDGSSAPLVSVIVAAKDEQDNIRACLESLIDQEYDNYEIIVVNDRSSDETGIIIDQLSDDHEIITALHVEHLPDDWMGKNHAMQKATNIAKGEYLLLTDADCIHKSSKALSVSMQYIKDEQVGLVSVLPNLECKTVWESMIQPICSGVMMIWFDPKKVNNPKRKNAYANGAFMLFERGAYDKIGQHEVIKGCMQEDMELGKLAKHSGVGLSVIRNDDLYTVRMYKQFSDLIQGWTRIFYGSFPTYTRGLLSLIAIVFMGILPHLVWIIGLVGLMQGAGFNSWYSVALITGGIAALLQQTAIFRFYKILKLNAWLCWTYPFSSFLVSYILIRAMSKLRPGAKVTWKGTSYKHKKS